MQPGVRAMVNVDKGVVAVAIMYMGRMSTIALE